MMITKRQIMASAAALVVAAAFNSCGSSDPVSTQTLQCPAFNLYTPFDSEEAPHVSPAVYTLNMDYVAATLKVTVSGMVWNNTSHSLVTDDVKFDNYYTSDGGTVIEFKNARGMVDNNASLSVDMAGYLTNRMYYSNVLTPGVAGGSFDYTAYPIVVMKYNIGDLYTVRTFNREAYWGGTTTTSFEMGGESQSFDNSSMIYRTVIDIEKKTADVVIYNAKFAEQMPKPLTGIILKGLEVEWLSDGYRIEGSDVVPEVIEGAATTPNEQYTFNSFTLQTTGDSMTACKVSYRVAGRFSGSFTGSTVVPASDSSKN